MRLRTISIKYIDNSEIEKYLVKLKQLKQIYSYKLINYTEIIKNSFQIALVMPEYIQSLSSINPVEYLTESSQYRVIHAICKALSRLHSCNIIHSSLHPGNVLLNKENKIVLTDIGINELFYHSEENFIITKPKVSYLSPEIIENKEITKKSDIWSFGCVIFYILNGKAIFDGNSIYEIEKNILGNITAESCIDYNKKLNDLISKLLKINPLYRLEIKQISNELDLIFNLNASMDSTLSITAYNEYPIFMKLTENEEKNKNVINNESIFINLRNSKTAVMTKYGEIKFQSGENWISNCLYYNETNGAVVIGETAKSLINSKRNKKQVLYNTLNMIGLDYNHPIVQENKNLYDYKIKNDNGSVKMRIAYGDENLFLSPTDVLSEVLKYIKKIADEILHQNIFIPTPVYITVPSNFTIYQMEEVVKAAEMSYLKVNGIFLESIAYTLKDISTNEIKDENENIMICGFERNYCEVTVLNINSKKMSYSSIFSDKNHNLSGNGFDEAIADFFIQRFEENTTKLFDKEKHHHTTKELRIECEKCKIYLIKYKYDEYEIDCDLLEEEEVDCHMNIDILSEISEKYTQKIINHIDNVLMKYGLKDSDLKKVYLIGESSRIPKYQEMMEKKFEYIKFVDQIDVLSSLNDFYKVEKLTN